MCFETNRGKAMRKFLYTILFPVAFIAFLGCNGKSTGQNRDCPVFDPLKTTKTVDDLEPYIDEVVLINPGEGDSLFFAHIKKMLVADGGDIVILGSGLICRFNSAGVLQNTYGMAGRGPGEYVSITDIAFSNDRSELLALNHLDQILVFDYLSGNYKGMIDTKWKELKTGGASGLLPGPASDLFLYIPNPAVYDTGDLKKEHRCLLKINENGEKISEAIPWTDFNIDINIFPFVTRAYDNSYLIRPQENENICYRIKDGEIHEFFKVHFGKQNIEPLFAFKDNDDPWNRLGDILGGPHYNTLLCVNVTEKHIFFHAFGPNVRQESFIVNRDGYTGLHWHNNGYEGDGFFISGADETYLYGVFMNYGEIPEEDLDKMDPLARYLIVKKKVFLPEDSNPLIVKIKFKNIG